MRILILVCTATLLPLQAWASVAPVGAEFQVNTYTTAEQNRPAVAASPSGAFVVVWEDVDGRDGSGYGIFGRVYDSAGVPIGDDFQVNTYTPGHQLRPGVRMDGSGGFVVAWDGQDGPDPGVVARRFDGTGAPLGPEFVVNAYTTGLQNTASMAMTSTGEFVVTWVRADSTGFVDVIGRIFDSTGDAVGDDFQVNTYTTFSQGTPAVAIDPSGSFVVVWTDFAYLDGDGFGVFGRRYDSAGGPIGGEFQVNTYTTGSQRFPAVAMDSAGGFVVVWEGAEHQDGHGRGVFGQRYDSAGAPLGGEFPINTFTPNDQSRPSVAMDSSGGFVVTWQDAFQDGSSDGIFARRYDSAGAPVGVDFQVNTFVDSFQVSPNVARDDSGTFVVSWSSLGFAGGQDGSNYGIFAQRLCDDTDGDGLCDSEDVLVTSPMSGGMLDCGDPRLDRPTFEWSAGNYDKFRVCLGSDPAFVKGTRVTSGDTLLKTTTWTPSGKKWRNACRKALAANPSSPVLFIKVFGVDVNLPKSDPHRKTLSQVVAAGVQF